MRFQLFMIGLCIVAAGCNADPRCRRETALLRAEILDLEDKYYLTKSQRDDALAILESRGGTAEAKKIASASRPDKTPQASDVIYGDVFYGGDEVIYGDAPYYESYEGQLPENQPYDYAPYGYTPTESQLLEAPSARANGSANPQSGEIFQLDLNTPEVIVPRESTLPIPSTDALPVPDPIKANPASSILLSVPANGISKNRASTQPQVTEVVIDRRGSRGHDADGYPGDEGLDLLLKPKTAGGETVLQAGHLTVSVIDPAAPSASQRIGMWKFVPAESELFFTDENSESRGILLNLPWEEVSPRGNQVVVFVRYQTNDGRRLETTAKIRINPPTGTPVPPQRADDDLIADRGNRSDQPLPPSPSANRTSVPAVPASSGPERVSKPNWRPVR